MRGNEPNDRSSVFAQGTSPVNLNLQGTFFFISNFHYFLYRQFKPNLFHPKIMFSFKANLEMKRHQFSFELVSFMNCKPFPVNDPRATMLQQLCLFYPSSWCNRLSIFFIIPSIKEHHLDMNQLIHRLSTNQSSFSIMTQSHSQHLEP